MRPGVSAQGGEHTVAVQLGARSYTIHVGAGILETLGARMHALGLGKRAAIVTNPSVERLYGERVRASLERSGFSPVTIEIPDGEEHKNLAWVAFISARLIGARLSAAR